MLLTLLLLGTPWFWAAWVIPAIILIYCVENEKSIGAIFTIIVAAAIWVAFGSKDILPWTVAHPKEIGIGIGVYIVLGIVWGFIKWFFYVLRKRDEYEGLKRDYLKNEQYSQDHAKQARLDRARDSVQKFGVGSADLNERRAAAVKAEQALIDAEPVKPIVFDKTEFKSFVGASTLASFPPTADKNKGRIIFWMTYWPASAIWTILNDPLRHLWNFIYNRLGHMFDGISKAMFAKHKIDFSDLK